MTGLAEAPEPITLVWAGLTSPEEEAGGTERTLEVPARALTVVLALPSASTRPFSRNRRNV